MVYGDVGNKCIEVEIEDTVKVQEEIEVGEVEVDVLVLAMRDCDHGTWRAQKLGAASRWPCLAPGGCRPCAVSTLINLRLRIPIRTRSSRIMRCGIAICDFDHDCREVVDEVGELRMGENGRARTPGNMALQSRCELIRSHHRRLPGRLM